MWVVYALLSAATAALVAIFGKMGLSKVDTTLATTVRSIIMALFLVLLSFSLGKWKGLAALNGKALLFVVLAGVAGALSWLFYFTALRTGTARGVVALDRLSVVFVLVLAALFLGEHLTWRSGLGAVMVTAGAVLMSIK